MASKDKHDFIDGVSYHIYNQCVSHVNYFENPINATSFLQKFHKYFDGYLSLNAYCLMPNHFHLIALVNDVDDILQHTEHLNESKAIILFRAHKISVNDLIRDQLRRFISSVTLSFKRKNKHRGPLFIEKTKHVMLRSEEKLFDKICYVHHNPIHHQFDSTYEGWEFSSYKTCVQEEIGDVGIQEMLIRLGSGNMLHGQEEFKRIHQIYKENYKEDQRDR